MKKTFSNLLATRNYQIQVRSIKADQASDWSPIFDLNSSNFTWKTGPNAPTGLVATSYADSIKLTWTASTVDVAHPLLPAYYEIYTGGSTVTSSTGTLIGSIPTTQYGFQTTNYNPQYFVIRAVDPFGNYSADVGPVMATPTQPVDMKALMTPVLGFTRPTGSTVVTYTVASHSLGATGATQQVFVFGTTLGAGDTPLTTPVIATVLGPTGFTATPNAQTTGVTGSTGGFMYPPGDIVRVGDHGITIGNVQNGLVVGITPSSFQMISNPGGALSLTGSRLAITSSGIQVYDSTNTRSINLSSSDFSVAMANRLNVVGISGSGAGVRTITGATAHNYNPGDMVSIYGSGSAAFNEDPITVLTVPSPKSFTYLSAAPGTWTVDGTTYIKKNQLDVDPVAGTVTIQGRISASTYALQALTGSAMSISEPYGFVLTKEQVINYVTNPQFNPTGAVWATNQISSGGPTGIKSSTGYTSMGSIAGQYAYRAATATNGRASVSIPVPLSTTGSINPAGKVASASFWVWPKTTDAILNPEYFKLVESTNLAGWGITSVSVADGSGYRTAAVTWPTGAAPLAIGQAIDVSGISNSALIETGFVNSFTGVTGATASISYLSSTTAGTGAGGYIARALIAPFSVEGKGAYRVSTAWGGKKFYSLQPNTIGKTTWAKVVAQYNIPSDWAYDTGRLHLPADIEAMQYGPYNVTSISPDFQIGGTGPSYRTATFDMSGNASHGIPIGSYISVSLAYAPALNENGLRALVVGKSPNTLTYVTSVTGVTGYGGTGTTAGQYIGSSQHVANADELWIGGAQLTLTQSQVDYFDGAHNDGTWGGTAHNSPSIKYAVDSTSLRLRAGGPTVLGDMDRIEFKTGGPQQSDPAIYPVANDSSSWAFESGVRIHAGVSTYGSPTYGATAPDYVAGLGAYLDITNTRSDYAQSGSQNWNVSGGVIKLGNISEIHGDAYWSAVKSQAITFAGPESTVTGSNSNWYTLSGGSLTATAPASGTLLANISATLGQSTQYYVLIGLQVLDVANGNAIIYDEEGNIFGADAPIAYKSIGYATVSQERRIKGLVPGNQYTFRLVYWSDAVSTATITNVRLAVHPTQVLSA